MIKKVVLVVLLVGGAAVAGIVQRTVREDNTVDQPSEIRQSYQLSPGSRVEISSINGSVEVETSENNVAELYIKRTGGRSALEDRRISIEQSPSSLTIRGEKTPGSFWKRFLGSGNAKETVVLKAPRAMALAIRGVNGNVQVGEVDGSMQVSGVNGKVELAQATGYSDVSGINGGVSLAVGHLGDRGLHVSGVNGGVQLRLAQGVNADFRASGMNGSVRSEIPGLIIQNGPGHSSFTARVGTGGSPITVSGVNGGVRLTGQEQS